MCSGSHVIDVSLVNDCGHLSITDTGLYPDGDSRSDRMNLGFNTIVCGNMSRKDLKELKNILKKVLRESKTNKVKEPKSYGTGLCLSCGTPLRNCIC